MDDANLRQHLIDLLTSRRAHAGFEAAVDGLPPELRGRRPEGLAYTAWQLLEHLRICQWDILEFCRRSDHVSPAWPKGYWTASEIPPHDAAWEECLTAFRRDLKGMCDLVADPSTDLLTPIPWGEPHHTVLQQALLLADHNAYHVGQLVSLRRLLDAWPPP